MISRPMTKEDNAIYANRSGIVLLAGNHASQAKDAANAGAVAADKAYFSTWGFAAEVRGRLENCEKYDKLNDNGAVY